MQWTGRQLQYNWTIPLLLAGGAAVKFALDNETAFTKIKKVYGDAQDAAEQFNKEAGLMPDALYGQQKAAQVFKNELDALSGAFEALSSRYGVAQKDVLEVGAAWAAAGQSGVALAQSTELTIKTSLIGDMDLVAAGKALISIQAQYGLSTKQLSYALAELNAIDNQTAIGMQGLIDGFGRSAGVAREAGIDVRHLGALLAALVPATGSAAQAGNALKTIISRIIAPTQDAADVMKAFGVDTSTAAWQANSAMDQLQILADKMNNTLHKSGDESLRLSSHQKEVVASVLGSRYQMNKFLVLMRELGPEQSYYEKALNATSDRQKVFKVATQELNAVLDSNPRKLKIILTTLQNGMATAIQPLIPYLLYLAGAISRMVHAFTSLDPGIQKLILAFLVALALVGPLTKYFSSLVILIITMAAPIRLLAGWFMALATSEAVVNGVTEVTRRSFIGMFATMLLAPFRWFIAGIGFMIGSLLASTRFLKVAQLAVGVYSLAWAAGAVAVRASVAGITTFVPLAWASMMRLIAAVQIQGLGVILKGWLLNLSLMAKYSLYSPIVTSFSAVFGTLQFVMGYWFKTFLAIAGDFAFRFNLILLAGWVRILAVFETFQLAMLGAWAAFSRTFLAGWAGIYLGISAIMTAGSQVLIRIWAAMTVGLNAVLAAGGMILTRTWAVVQIAMSAISMQFWSQMIRIWLVGMTGLMKLLPMMLKVITTFVAQVRFALAVLGPEIIAFLIGPWGIAIGIVVALLLAFRKQIAQAWGNIVNYFADSSNAMTQTVLNAWNALPKGITNALVAVVRVVQAAALAVYHWFSYLNPFAHHSPSLVENVTKGMAVVKEQFRGMAASVGRDIKAAYNEIKAFGRATANLRGRSNTIQEHEQRQKIAKFDPGALAAFDKLSHRLKILNRDLAMVQAAEDRQQKIVDKWTDVVERLNNKIDRQQKKLEALQAIQSKWADKLQAAQDSLSAFANAPIKGMQAMSDAIFENEMAQKRLQLQMMKLEEVTGPLDDIKSKMDAINGAQEMLSGKRGDLAAGGAGSDILKTYDDQISALEKQKKSYNSSTDALQSMSDQLDELARKGQLLDLQNSLKFDPLTRQIERAAYAMKELPFDQIMAGIKGAQSDIIRYQDRLDDATAAVDRQQAAVDRLTASRDKMQAILDRENAKLEKIKDTYDAISQAIQDVSSAMSDAATAADTLAQAAEKAKEKSKSKTGGSESISPALAAFQNAGKGDLPTAGGSGFPIRTDWADQTDQIQKYTDSISQEAANAFADINPFNSIKKKFGEFAGWAKQRWSDFASAANDMFSHIFGGSSFGDAADGFRVAWAKVSDWFSKNVISPIMKLWDLFGPSIKEIVTNAMHGFQNIWKQISPVLAKIGDDFKDILPALKGFWRVIKLVALYLYGDLVPIIKIALEIIANTIYPILEALGGILKGALQMVHGVIQIIMGFFMLFTSDWKRGLHLLLIGVLNILKGLMTAVVAIFKGAWKILLGVVRGIVEGVVEFFVWLYDVLVGHSIIPDLVKAIFHWFEKLGKIAKWIWDHVLHPIVKIFGKVLQLVVAVVKLWFKGIIGALKVLWAIAKWIWDYVLVPIFDVWKAALKVVIALVKLWWKGIPIEWKILTTVAKWLWDHVLKPIFKKYKELWDKLVKPALKLWWTGIQAEWKILTTLAKWYWEHVLKPIYTKVKDLWNKNVKPALKLWWAGIQAEWKILWGAAKWLWEHVLKPIYEKVKDVWNKYIKPALKAWWEGIRNAWNSLLALGKWFWDHILKPLWDRFKDAWEKIRETTRNAKERIGEIIDGIKAKFTGLIDTIKGLPGKIKDFAGNFKTAGAKIIGSLWNGMKTAGSV